MTDLGQTHVQSKDNCQTMTIEANRTKSSVVHSATQAMWITIMVGIVVLGSALHFWPFPESRLWQLLNPVNSVLLIWTGVWFFIWLRQKKYGFKQNLWPHISVLAYLMINGLSTTYGNDSSRSITFTVKLGVIFLAGYSLVSYAACHPPIRRRIYHFIVIAALLNLTYSLIGQFLGESNSSGFFTSSLKHGTYTAIMTSLAGAYLASSSSRFWRLLGFLTVSSAFLAISSWGALVALFLTIGITGVMAERGSLKYTLFAGLIFGVLGLVLVNFNGEYGAWQDRHIQESQSSDIRQRYLEWQAAINLYEERTIGGTGAGCFNEQRSTFYHRLPKNNTLAPFDQNGWLVTGAETGFLGLVCFCWAMLIYGKPLVSSSEFSKHLRMQLTCRAGFIALCTANVFSAIHFNGMIILMPLVLGLIASHSNIKDPMNESS